MGARVPKGRLARGGTLGRLAAEQTIRGVGTRLSMLGRTEQARRVLAERSTLQSAQQLVTVLGGLRGAAMKLGQMLSVLDVDLLPDEHREMFRAKLAELRDHAPQVPFDRMRTVLEDELGPLSRTFADFDETAIAAASIGQVYRAKLRDGREVAVKVKYPGVDEAVEADMRNLAMFSRLWKSMLPSAADSDVLDEIARNIGSELDYPREARNQHRVAERYRGHPYILVPDSIEEYCRPSILVSEFVDGQSFDRLRKLPETDRDRCGELIYRFYIDPVFTAYEFCGDPHPGNILLAADGRLAFVDFGLYHSMDPAHVELERAAMQAAVEQRGPDLYDGWVRRGIIDPDSGVSVRECLEYVWAAAGWQLLDEPITLDPEFATGALVLAIDPRSAEFRGMRSQRLPPEHVFSRRVDLFTLAALGQLGCTNNWHRLAREWMYREQPVTEIGRTIARWRDTR
ncbi:ABC1 kinase family protein [Nocardia macrotermitis]|uniref:Protein kinase UbiB n=1 Tax=Nocardia macrotermitis TaxID=2585198 RepID=A0A7K0CVK6_9NOCA|nr:AarF/ABC1/UbiB kinase family protein [Nocardia macrotermitis]MQY17515.1 protein kinase UbiB [Nocardia macrotermitis]